MYSYQKTILEIIRTFGAVRTWHIKSLVRNHFPDHFRRDRAYIDILAQTEQLVRYHHIRRNGDIVFSDDDRVDYELLDAIDVMLQISDGTGLQLYRKGEPPIKLTFFREKGEKLIRYDVCFLKENGDYIAAYFPDQAEDYRKLVIVVPQMGTQRLPIALDHCYAVREGDGFRFFQ